MNCLAHGVSSQQWNSNYLRQHLLYTFFRYVFFVHLHSSVALYPALVLLYEHQSDYTRAHSNISSTLCRTVRNMASKDGVSHISTESTGAVAGEFFNVCIGHQTIQSLTLYPLYPQNPSMPFSADKYIHYHPNSLKAWVHLQHQAYAPIVDSFPPKCWRENGCL